MGEPSEEDMRMAREHLWVHDFEPYTTDRGNELCKRCHWGRDNDFHREIRAYELARQLVAARKAGYEQCREEGVARLMARAGTNTLTAAAILREAAHAIRSLEWKPKE